MESTALSMTAMMCAGGVPDRHAGDADESSDGSGGDGGVDQRWTPRWLTAGWVGSVSRRFAKRSPILEMRCAPKHATTRVHPATARASGAGSGSVTSPGTISAPRAASSAATGEWTSRVMTRTRTPIAARRRTTRAPTRPAPPTTSTSSSAAGVGRSEEEGGASGDAARAMRDAARSEEPTEPARAPDASRANRDRRSNDARAPATGGSNGRDARARARAKRRRDDLRRRAGPGARGRHVEPPRHAQPAYNDERGPAGRTRHRESEIACHRIDSPRARARV